MQTFNKKDNRAVYCIRSVLAANANRAGHGKECRKLLIAILFESSV